MHPHTYARIIKELALVLLPSYRYLVELRLESKLEYL
jgi:hypothetical protein